jgi:hypothetical protein
MRRHHLRGILTLVALSMSVACFRRGKTPDLSSAEIQAITSARITNKNWLDVNVYAVRAGTRERIGIVRAFDTQVFVLPPYLLDTRGLRLHVDPIGSPQSYQTDVIPVWPGQWIHLVVQEKLNQSHYSVFDP